MSCCINNVSCNGDIQLACTLYYSPSAETSASWQEAQRDDNVGLTLNWWFHTAAHCCFPHFSRHCAPLMNVFEYVFEKQVILNRTLHHCQRRVHKFRPQTEMKCWTVSGAGTLEADVPFTAYIHIVASPRCNWRKNKASLAFCSVHCGEFDENVTLKMHVPHTFFGLCL